MPVLKQCDALSLGTQLLSGGWVPTSLPGQGLNSATVISPNRYAGRSSSHVGNCSLKADLEQERAIIKNLF